MENDSSSKNYLNKSRSLGHTLSKLDETACMIFMPNF